MAMNPVDNKIYTFNDKVKVNIYDNLEIDFSTFNLS